jgi:outer membrane cobalamin receptor
LRQRTQPFAASAALVFSLSALPAAGAQAQQALSEVVVTGSRTMAAAAPAAEVLTLTPSMAETASSAADLARQVPGVVLLEPGGAGGRAELYYRGADPNFLAILVEGVPVNDIGDARGGGYDFSTLGPEELGQIELARGPFSSLYGSGALAGVMNLRLRDDGEGALGAYFAAGTEGFWTASVGLRGAPAENLKGSVRLRTGDSGEATPFSSRTLSAATGRLEARLSDATRVDGFIRLARRKRAGFEVSSGGPLFAANRELERAEADEAMASVQLSHSGQARTLARLSAFQREETIATPGQPEGVFSGLPASLRDTRFQRAQLLASSAWNLSSRLAAAAGVEMQHEEARTRGYLDFGFFQAPADFELSRDTAAAFGELRAGLGAGLEVFASIRGDGYSDAKAALTQRAGLLWRSEAAGLTGELSWGRGHKRPSLYALGDPLVGNPALEAEESHGVEARVEKALFGGAWRVTATAFRTQYDDLIDFDFATFKLVNRAKVEIDGGELRLDGSPSADLDLSAYVAAARNEVDGQEGALLHRPELSGGARAEWRPTAGWRLMARAHGEGERPSASTPTGPVRLGRYVRLDLAAAREVARGVEVSLSADNVLGTEYQTAAGFPASGAVWRLAVSIR